MRLSIIKFDLEIVLQSQFVTYRGQSATMRKLCFTCSCSWQLISEKSFTWQLFFGEIGTEQKIKTHRFF